MLRKGLEKFLRKVAHHPVLGCTRFIKVFLTDENAKSDKVWYMYVHVHLYVLIPLKLHRLCMSNDFPIAGMEDWQASQPHEPQH